MSNYIFDIPVYRCDEITHSKEYEEIKTKKLLSFNKDTTPLAYTSMEQWIEQEYWYPWKFNEIVGYLRLFIDGHRIKGDLHHIKARKLRRGTSGKIFYYSKIFEYTPNLSDASLIIYNNLLNNLRLLKHPPLHRRYLDLDGFIKYGKFVDWRKLLDAQMTN